MSEELKTNIELQDLMTLGEYMGEEKTQQEKNIEVWLEKEFGR